MNKEDLLEKIRMENENNDPYESEVVRFAWRIGAIVAVAISLVVYYLELIFWGKYNCGLFLSCTTPVAIKFNIEAFKFKTVSSIVYAVIFSILLIVIAVGYVIAFINGWL